MKARIEKILYAPNGQTSVVLTSDSTFTLIDSQKNTISKKQKGKINHVAFSDDGEFFLTCSEDGLTKLWSLTPLREGELTYAGFGHLLMEMPLGTAVLKAFFDEQNQRIVGTTKAGKLFSCPLPHVELSKMFSKL